MKLMGQAQDMIYGIKGLKSPQWEAWLGPNLATQSEGKESPPSRSGWWKQDPSHLKGFLGPLEPFKIALGIGHEEDEGGHSRLQQLMQGRATIAHLILGSLKDFQIEDFETEGHDKKRRDFLIGRRGSSL